MGTDRASLLGRQVPHDNVVIGRAYIIHARNGGVGVAVREDGLLGYRLYREKFGRHYLCVKYDWADDERFGTAIPLRLLADVPPNEDAALLAWLTDQENEHRDEISGAWREVIGDLVDAR